MLITLIVFILIIGLLVFIHELGHFLLAKWNDVRVEEFAFGFRPRLLAWQKGETTYVINLIPLGGYVKMYGEQPGEQGAGSFKSKSVAQRFVILIAGVVMNLLFGWLLLTALFIVGFSPLFPGVAKNPFVDTLQEVSVVSVAPSSPAAAVGLQPGDLLLKVNGQKVATDQEFVSDVSAAKGRATILEVRHNNEIKTVITTPRVSPPPGEGALGVSLTSNGSVKTSLAKAPLAGLYETGRIIGISAAGFVDFVKTLIVRQRVSEDVTGLVGVGVLTGVVRQLGFSYLVQLVAMISIGLGVVNLMPILPLDGGHIAALIYEKIIGRPLNERQLGALATAGLMFVLLLFVAVTYKDLIRFDIFKRIFSQ